MRDPTIVIGQILAIVPAEERVLRSELERIKSDSWFLPPEGKHPAWLALKELLEMRFPGRPPDGWPMEVSAIVRDQR